MPVIRLMAGYGAFPLWGPDGMIAPDELAPAPPLVARLERWADRHDRELGPGFEWSSEEARLAFIAEGRQLLALLRRELGDSFDITFVDHY
ncbi:hypothetical protein AB0J83_26545 [Actinoplanes sp. NPDC049596]|uniref:hypothetical protein n=1 Tax=unclassified Actinoplanes TaxID=2626549 RepID=UPI0034483953